MTDTSRPAAASLSTRQPTKTTNIDAAHPNPVGVPPDLLAWAAQPGPAAVLAAARDRCEAGHRGSRLPLNASLDDAGRRAVSTLLGLPWRVSGQPATLGLLRAGLAERSVVLEDLLSAVGGPLRNRKLELAQQRKSRSDADAGAFEALTAAGVLPAIARVANARWLGPRNRRLDVAEQIAAVLACLPASAGTLLATLASDEFSDPHALDKDRLLGRACARILAATRTIESHAQGSDRVAAQPSNQADVADTRPEWTPDTADLDAETWRDIWERVGVTCDRVLHRSRT